MENTVNKQFLVIGKGVMEIEEGKSAKWVMDNMRGNGYKVSCIFTIEDIERAKTNECEYKIHLIETKQNAKFKYINEGIAGNVRIINGRLEW